MKLITPEELSSVLHQPRPLANSRELIKDTGFNFHESLILYSSPFVQPPLYLATLRSYRAVYLIDLSTGHFSVIRSCEGEQQLSLRLHSLDQEQLAERMETLLSYRRS